MKNQTVATVFFVLLATCFVTGQEQTTKANYTIYQVGGDVTAPRPISTPMPATPDSVAKDLKAYLSFVVTPDGSVTNVRVLRRSKSELDDFAVNVVSNWKFEPATKDGKPVAVRLETEFRSHHAVQQPPTNPQALVQLAYLKTELPSRRSGTCIAVLPDGHFQLEKRWRETVTVGYGSQVFEGTLSDARLRALEQILAADDLKNIKTTDQLTSATYEAEFVQTAVPRPEGLQYFSLVGLESLPEQHPRPLPDAVKPLVQWFQITSKEIEKQRTALLKNGKTGNCGLPDAPGW